jgi:YidC/Oxa1 family membrane protein insertase
VNLSEKFGGFDVVRIGIILGLAVTTYLLILAWNNDYGSKVAAPLADTRSELPSPASLPSASASPGFAEVPGIAGEADVVRDEIPELASSPVVDPNRLVPPAGAPPVVRIETDVLSITVDPRGGDITAVLLPAYPVSLDSADSFPLIDAYNEYSIQTGLIGRDGVDKPTGRPVYRADATIYRMDGKETLIVDLVHESETAIITKRFTLRRGDYLVDIDYLVTNRGFSDWQGAMFAQIKRNGADPQIEEQAGMGLQPYVGGATFTLDENYHKLDFEDIAELPFEQRINGGYMSLVQHYFVTALVPKDAGENHYQARKLKSRDVYLMGLTAPTISVPAGAEASTGVKFYAGPKNQYRLSEIAEGLDLTVDYGFLWWLAQPLFYLLTKIHSVVDNWGVAIIILVIIIKACLYPLSAASFRSLAKMKKLQPEMVRLKERHADDRQQFSQAMMELYKKEGANPFGGCFPILLQMPVFLALYWALMESVELRQAPFALWIHDLSAMDPYFVLPIIMGGSMFLTQMMQPEPPDPMQAKVMKMLPIMFTFFFLWFPAGLVLYWVVNNLLSVLQQWYVNRKIARADKA